MSRIWLRAIQGACLSVGAPLGWMSMQALAGHSIGKDLQDNPFLYLYMLLSCMVAFAVLGSLLGHHEDGLLKANKLLDELSVTDPVTGFRQLFPSAGVTGLIELRKLLFMTAFRIIFTVKLPAF